MQFDYFISTEALWGSSLLLLLSSQKFLVLILSTLEGWKAGLTLEPPSCFKHRTSGLGIQHLNQDGLKGPEFNLTTHDSYFTILVEVFTNHILAENTYFANRIEWTKHSIMVLRLSNKYQIILHHNNFKNILVDDHPFFFSKLKITNWKDETINHSNIYYYYLIYGARKAFLKLCNRRNFDFSCSIEMYVIMCKTKYLNN